MIIEDIFRDRIAKLKAVKEYSDKKSLPNWKIPVMHGFLMCLLGSIYGARLLVNPYLEGNVHEAITAFMPLILLFGSFFTIMDLVAKAMVWINWAVIQCVMKAISRIDTRIWRKYKREDFVASKIWNVQMKFQKMDKVTRKRMMAVMIMFAVMWMSYRVMY
tara:strand:+ start:851 stop:1333 length:483 start_codon:yes stop_codon:yes gene_type:complete